jgi:hypothetical protein
MKKQHANHVNRWRVAEEISSAERASLDGIDLTYDPDDPIGMIERKMYSACSRLVENPKHHEARVYLQCLLAEFQGSPVRVFQEALKNWDSITDKAWRDAQRELKFFLREQKK